MNIENQDNQSLDRPVNSGLADNTGGSLYSDAYTTGGVRLTEIAHNLDRDFSEVYELPADSP